MIWHGRHGGDLMGLFPNESTSGLSVRGSVGCGCGRAARSSARFNWAPSGDRERRRGCVRWCLAGARAAHRRRSSAFWLAAIVLIHARGRLVERLAEPVARRSWRAAAQRRLDRQPDWSANWLGPAPRSIAEVAPAIPCAAAVVIVCSTRRPTNRNLEGFGSPRRLLNLYPGRLRPFPSHPATSRIRPRTSRICVRTADPTLPLVASTRPAASARMC